MIHIDELHLSEEIIDRVRQVLTVAFLNKHFKVILDLEGCTMIDSFFIGLIIQTYRELRELGGNLRCASVNENVKHAFEVIRLNQVIDICETVDDAIEMFENEDNAQVE
ncbi:STAS domain-containing protein [bacterium]|nr:STAS domain-containing protein [bacterium]